MRSLKITPNITERQDASLMIFLKEVSKIPSADMFEEEELAKRIQEGDKKAVNRLIEANLRFAISVAKQYQGKGLPLVDLIQYSILGAHEAALKWDPSKGAKKFISYAVWWMRQSIMQALSDTSRTIRLPMNQIVNMRKITKATDKLSQTFNRIPVSEELEKETELKSSHINYTLNVFNKISSLDSKFKEGEEGTLLDVIPNTNANSSDNNLIQESIKDELDEILRTLSNREYDSIKLYFGIGLDQMTLEEIAIRFGVGAERIRQIIQEALEKLRQNYSEQLKTLL